MLLCDLADAPEEFRSVYVKKRSGENAGFIAGSGVDKKKPAVPCAPPPLLSTE